MQTKGKTFHNRILMMLFLGAWSCQTASFDPFETPPMGQKISLEPLPIAPDGESGSSGTSPVKAMFLLPPAFAESPDSGASSVPVSVSFENLNGDVLSLNWSDISSGGRSAECSDSDPNLGDLLRNHSTGALVCDPEIISHLSNSHRVEFNLRNGKTLVLTSWANLSPSFFYGKVHIYMFPH